MPEERRLPNTIKKHKWSIVAALIATSLVIGITAILNRTERSVGAYCSVRQEQQEKLKAATGKAYSSALLPGVQSDRAADFAEAMAKMEGVAPDEIQSNVRIQRLAFEKVYKDPSQTMGAALGAITAEENAKIWTEQHCGELDK